jgi:hypothetical protein
MPAKSPLARVNSQAAQVMMAAAAATENPMIQKPASAKASQRHSTS